MKTAGAFDIFRYRQYRRYAAAQTLSQTGGYVNMAGLAWLVIDSGQGAAAVGTVTAARYAPALLNPVAGRLADRFDRRRVVAVGESFAGLAAIALAVVAVIGDAPLIVISVVAALVGLGSVTAAPSHESIPASLVSHDRLTAVSGATSALGNIARLTSPLIAVALIAASGPMGCFVFNAFSSMVVMAVALKLKLATSYTVGGGRRGVISLVRRTPALRRLIGPYFIWCVFGPQTTLLMPLMAVALNGGAGLGGVLQSATAAGGLLASLIVMSRIKASFAWFHIGLLASGLTCVLAAYSFDARTAVLAIAVMGVANTLTQAVYNAMVLQRVPDADRGKAMSVGLMILFGGVMAGSLIFGQIVATLGVPAAFLVSAVICVAMSSWLLAAEAKGGRRLSRAVHHITEPVPLSVRPAPHRPRFGVALEERELSASAQV